MSRHIISIGEAMSAVDYWRLKENLIASMSDAVKKESKFLYMIGTQYRVGRSDKLGCRMTDNLEEAVEWYNYGW